MTLYLGFAIRSQEVTPRFVLRPIHGAVRVVTDRPTPCPLCLKRGTEFVLRCEQSRCIPCDLKEFDA